MTGPQFQRRPDQIIIIPSARQPWYGSWEGEHRFTRQQQAALISRGADPLTVETVEVRREATYREMWWPERKAPPIFAFACPIIGRRADGRLDVIAPDGQPHLVLANGWVRMPRHRDNRQHAAPLPDMPAPRRRARTPLRPDLPTFIPPPRRKRP